MNYQISNQMLQAVISSKGAELQSLRDYHQNEYLWQGDAAYWGDRSPNIFPYVGRLTEGKYHYRGQEYQMAIHGFVPYLELVPVEQTGSSICFQLTSCEKTRQQYPFEFEYKIEYRLKDAGLEVIYTVLNKDSKTMYFGIGGHPGFHVPSGPGLEFTDYSLIFSRPSNPVRIGFDKTCYRNGEDQTYSLVDDQILPLSHDLFDQDAIVLTNMPEAVSLSGGNRRLTMRYPGMKYLGFWHMPHTDAPYVCIEPWSSLPSRAGIIEDIEEQSDLVSLPVGESYRAAWELQIDL